MIELINVNKNFNSHKVLDNLSLKIETGSTLVIIGRSGCGKSVTLKHIIGLMKPDSGTVLVDGKEVGKMNPQELVELRQRTGMVFQGGALFDSMTVGENVGYSFIEHSDMPRSEILERVEESLSMVGLYGIANMMPSELSGGMKKRVAIARAICSKPQIIMYDEPTTGVDPITADNINDLIIEMHDQLKATSIVVTHDMKSAYKVASRIAMLYKGKIIADGTPAEIQNTTHPVVYQFINGLAKGPITETLDRFR